jgi:hypothetical protein
MPSSLVLPINFRLPEDPECSRVVYTFHIPFSRVLHVSFEDWQQWLTQILEAAAGG